jgi:F-type H+-transporting ATPase subunit b
LAARKPLIFRPSQRADAVVTIVRLLVIATAALWAGAALSAQQPEEKSAAEPHAPAATDAHAPAKAEDSHGAEEHGHAGHAHDDTDLSHGNATAALASPADLRFDMSIYTLIVFLILMAILYKFAWGPISHALDQREETILRQLAEAKAAAEKATHQLQEYEARLAAATEEARQIVGQARKDAETAKDKIVAAAQESAAKERDRAVADITAAKNQALAEIAGKSVSTAISLASNIIRREVKAEDHDQLINQSLQQFTSLN